MNRLLDLAVFLREVHVQPLHEQHLRLDMFQLIALYDNQRVRADVDHDFVHLLVALALILPNLIPQIRK